ncbi:hypothetical protein EMIT053CA3_210004 [Pseudomonas donghuensis]
MGDCQLFAVLVGIGQLAGSFLPGLLERHLADTAKGDVLVPCPGDHIAHVPAGQHADEKPGLIGVVDAVGLILRLQAVEQLLAELGFHGSP